MTGWILSNLLTQAKPWVSLLCPALPSMWMTLPAPMHWSDITLTITWQAFTFRLETARISLSSNHLRSTRLLFPCSVAKQQIWLLRSQVPPQTYPIAGRSAVTAVPIPPSLPMVSYRSQPMRQPRVSPLRSPRTLTAPDPTALPSLSHRKRLPSLRWNSTNRLLRFMSAALPAIP